MSDRLSELHAFSSIDGDLLLRAGIERTGTHIALRWVLGGAVRRQRVPARRVPSQRADRLWEHTCFEAFLAPVDGSAYWELNLSPAGDWNMYRFDGYREGMRPEVRAQAPVGGIERASCGTVTMRAVIDLGAIPELTSGPLDVGLAAVLEASDATLSYWALRHAAARPDFHRRETFVLRLPAEGAA